MKREIKKFSIKTEKVSKLRKREETKVNLNNDYNFNYNMEIIKKKKNLRQIFFWEQKSGISEFINQ